MPTRPHSLRAPLPLVFLFFFFNDTATTEIYTLSLHDALPISAQRHSDAGRRAPDRARSAHRPGATLGGEIGRHTSELQSRLHLVCRLLLEKKKKQREPDLDSSVSSETTKRTARAA